MTAVTVGADPTYVPPQCNSNSDSGARACGREAPSYHVQGAPGAVNAYMHMPKRRRGRVGASGYGRTRASYNPGDVRIGIMECVPVPDGRAFQSSPSRCGLHRCSPSPPSPTSLSLSLSRRLAELRYKLGLSTATGRRRACRHHPAAYFTIREHCSDTQPMPWNV